MDIFKSFFIILSLFFCVNAPTLNGMIHNDSIMTLKNTDPNLCLTFQIILNSISVLCEPDGKIAANINPNTFPPNYQCFMGDGELCNSHPMTYLMRLYNYFSCPKEPFAIAFIYIQRVIEKAKQDNIQNVFNHISFYRMYLAALLVAVKFWCDKFYPNSYYADVGGVPPEELNILEIFFLQIIDYDLYIDLNETEILGQKRAPKDVTKKIQSKRRKSTPPTKLGKKFLRHRRSNKYQELLINQRLAFTLKKPA